MTTSDTIDATFALHHRAEILAIVERMLRERALTTVEFADGHALVSSLLEVRRDANVMVFDVARDPEQNRRLFASQTLGFVTELDHVQVAFETGPASLIARVDGPAAVVELPSSVIRLQRRAWFRAALPVMPPIRCTVLDRNGQATPAQAIDLSPGGAALIVDDPAARHTQAGCEHELILSLPDVGRLELDATLRTVKPTGAADGARSRIRMGYRFDAVPARTASRIQRYVQHVEVSQLRVLRRRGG